MKNKAKRKRIMCRTIQIMLFPFYLGAYTIAHLLKVRDRENMPTIKEWFEIEESEEE